MTGAGAKALLVVAVLAVLPPLSSALLGDAGPRCATDGVVPGPLLRIHTEPRHGAPGASHVFCSVACAERWRASFPGEPVRLRVADEATGVEMDADQAWFVRSSVPTLRASSERIHVFGSRETAEAHAAAHGGRILAGDARPLSAGGRP